MIRTMEGKSVDVCGAAIATVVGTFLLDISPDEKTANDGLDAIIGDARTFIKSTHLHKGTPH